MRCTKCGYENPPDSRHCGKCGAMLPMGEKENAYVIWRFPFVLWSTVYLDRDQFLRRGIATLAIVLVMLLVLVVGGSPWIGLGGAAVLGILFLLYWWVGRRSALKEKG